MRIRITFEKEGAEEFFLPLHYNHLVQGWIYKSVSKRLSRFLHDSGFIIGKRQFKLFVFSRLLGRFKILGEFIYFNGPVWLYIGSPLDRFMQDFANGLFRSGTLQLGTESLRIKEIAILDEPNFDKENYIRMLSPVTTYSTLLTPDGRRKTYYYSPMEKEFRDLLNRNALKKYQLLYGRALKGPLQVEPIRVKESIVMYKDTVVRGWTGCFKLDGPKTLIKTVYDAGLGSKNSEGFGMFEVIENC
ncbi:MAG: CRISPR-associated endoribonuclease Cas6 [Nitrososphaerota archaeon]